MTVIKRKTIAGYIKKHPDAESGLLAWLSIHQSTSFDSIISLRKAYPSADNIKGTDLVCININGNKYRLLVRYTWGKTVFIKDFVSHAEYSKRYC